MTAQEVETIWDRRFNAQQPLIEAALAHAGGTHTYADIAQLLADQRVQYWPGEQSVVITQIVDHPRKRVCHCFLAAGDMDELAGMRKWIEAWARSQGCDAATLTGRRGWERALRADGYQLQSVSLEKNLREA